MSAETQRQDKDLQVIGELDILSDTVQSLIARTESLEDRLQKVILTPSETDSEGQKEAPQLCDMAERIQQSRREIQKVNYKLAYIFDNLQL